ncbi:hypothetical protein KPZU09_64770 [Klebsiella pneumoniae]|uniref:Uncharacterized protein n=1 Tax=Klebsiella pneumoniae TaxID=573 RepID=A0A919LRR1_KLEPN|nr:hypothetical protein KPZU09_64770 [Klebsiella pneumoniae]
MPGCAGRPAPAGRLLHLTLRQGNRLTLRQPLQSGSHLLQNSAIDAATAERQGGIAPSNGPSLRAFFS